MLFRSRNYGLPESYYAKGELGTQPGFEKFLAGDVSAAELEDRIQTAQNRVINAAPEIKTALQQFYPGITNGDILAYTLDPQQALVIAQTEMSRAVVQSELSDYRDSGVEMVEWLVADPCDDCAANEDASPIGIDESWPSGDAPVHPNCMCDIAPYMDATLSVTADITKSVPSKIEVERALSRLKILPNPPDLDPS